MAAVAGLVLTGCGSESDGGSGGTPSSPPTPTMPTITQSSAARTGLPLVVTRTGGFAGFDDKVVIDTGGVATVSSRGKTTVHCKLDQSLLTTITAAAQQVDWDSLPVVKPSIRHPDDMIVAVTANGKTARLEEPRVKAMTAPVSTLLTEATIPPGKLCKPV